MESESPTVTTKPLPTKNTYPSWVCDFDLLQKIAWAVNDRNEARMHGPTDVCPQAVDGVIRVLKEMGYVNAPNVKLCHPADGDGGAQERQSK